ncbi:MAG TPA: hypothetical protein VMN39_09215 [Longimicrobiaceae bacterium]|nr:hypothetical protein [Longimicrobiaceae bacterium]
MLRLPVAAPLSVIAVLVAFPVTAPVPAGELDARPRYALENGDVNGDWDRDLADPVYLLSHLYLGGPAPVPLAFCADGGTAVENGDGNGDRALDLSDAVYILNWLFAGGSAPEPVCGPFDGAGAARNLNPRVLPPHARPYGKSYGEWSGDWWAWVLSQPGSVNPLVDEDGSNCDQGQSGPVWYLAGAICFSDAPVGEPDPCQFHVVERHCTVPVGKAIFFPIANAEADNLGVDPPLSEEELRAAAAGLFEIVTDLTAEVDGRPILGLNPPAESPYRVTTPEPFSYTFPDGDNIFSLFGLDFPGQTVEGAVADGVFLMLPPLSRGEHVVRFGAFFEPINFGFDITYHLTVE